MSLKEKTVNRMTIDEAIKHCLEEAGELQKRADSAELIDVLGGLDVEACKECAAEHRQLAEWLMELKDTRAALNDCGVEIEMLLGELKEAKRLLKLAVEDMSEKNFCTKVCKRDNFACRVSDTCDFKWRYTDEALKLIES